MFDIINDGMTRVRLGLKLHTDRFGPKATRDRIVVLQRELSMLEEKLIVLESKECETCGAKAKERCCEETEDSNI